MAETLSIGLIITDREVNCRLPNTELVKEYAEDMRGGANFPPVKVVSDGTSHWCWDGAHTIRACLELGLKEVEADVVLGDLRTARLLACGANAEHGSRRSHQELCVAVSRARELLCPQNMDYEQVAAACHCSVAAVKGTIRQDKPKPERSTGKPKMYGQPKRKPPKLPGDEPEVPNSRQVQSENGPAPMRDWNDQLEIWCAKLRQLTTELPTGGWMDGSKVSTLTQQLNNIVTGVLSSKGQCLCSACGGRRCRSCRNTGFVTRAENSRI